jgi:hypothetical protein
LDTPATIAITDDASSSSSSQSTGAHSSRTTDTISRSTQDSATDASTTTPTHATLLVLGRGHGGGKHSAGCEQLRHAHTPHDATGQLHRAMHRRRGASIVRGCSGGGIGGSTPR